MTFDSTLTLWYSFSLLLFFFFLSTINAARVNCDGYMTSCDNQIFNYTSTNASLTCSGSSTCTDVQYFCRDSSSCTINCLDLQDGQQMLVECSSKSNCTIFCSGDKSCSYSQFICQYGTNCNIQCYGSQSCTGACCSGAGCSGVSLPQCSLTYSLSARPSNSISPWRSIGPKTLVFGCDVNLTSNFPSWTCNNKTVTINESLNLSGFDKIYFAQPTFVLGSVDIWSSNLVFEVSNAENYGQLNSDSSVTCQGCLISVNVTNNNITTTNISLINAQNLDGQFSIVAVSSVPQDNGACISSQPNKDTVSLTVVLSSSTSNCQNGHSDNTRRNIIIGVVVGVGGCAFLIAIALVMIGTVALTYRHRDRLSTARV